MEKWYDTVDGSEIRRSPVEVGSLSHYLQGFCLHHVQDFFHSTASELTRDVKIDGFVEIIEFL